MKTIVKHWKPLLGAFLYASFSGMPVLADDTEVYLGGNAGNTGSSSPANILFIIDTSGSMKHHPGSSSPSNYDPTDPLVKINTVKNIFKDIIYDPKNRPKGKIDLGDDTTIFSENPLNPNFAGKNFALMRFDKGDGDNNTGGAFLTGFIPLDDTTATKKANVKKLFDKVWELSPTSYTPLAETLYEATRFYRGMAPDFGSKSDPVNVTDVIEKDNTYYSPFEAENAENKNKNRKSCSTTNHVVVLTDGAPNKDTAADVSDKIPSLTGYPNGTCGGDGSNNCLPTLAEYLYKTDLDGDSTNGVQNVMTHTIAFDLDDEDAQNLLIQTAANGHGEYKAPTDALGLAEALNEIISSIQVESASFAAPSVSIDSTNKLLHNATMYFSMFKPEGKPRWKGNVKGYKIDNNVLVDFSNPEKTLLDNDGRIVDDAKSQWSTSADGADVLAGGAASLASTARNVFTNLTDGALNISGNQVHESNASLTNTILGVTPAERSELIQWARGVDVKDQDGDQNTTEVRHTYGDPLHSQPAIVDYGNGNTYMFFGTNDGKLHAIDVATGLEQFAFIPQVLLPNLKTLYDNIAPTTLKRPYGIDGNVTAAKIGGNVHLFFGMRRGGRNYYAMDVSDIKNPILKWKIEGGTSGFEELGQSWATPVLTKVRLGTDEYIAMIISGGYDAEAEDPVADGVTAAPRSTGRAVYIINALTGEKLWMAHGSGANGSGVQGTRSNSELVIDGLSHSIPATIATLDVDLDDVADRLYFADISGQMFRIDLNATETETAVDGTETTVTRPNGGMIASLRGTDPADQRRFYNEVELVFTKHGAKKYISLNVGSGYRANPLNTVLSDGFYSVRDDLPYQERTDYTNVIDIDALSNVSSGGNINTILSTHKGWYINMGTNEKVLSDSFTLNNNLMFTSYTPPDPNNMDPCKPPLGTAKLYVINLFDGSARLATRAVEMKSGGIPPSPAIVFTDNGPDTNPGIKVLVGMETVSDLTLEAILEEDSTWTTNPK